MPHHHGGVQVLVIAMVMPHHHGGVQVLIIAMVMPHGHCGVLVLIMGSSTHWIKIKIAYGNYVMVFVTCCFQLSLNVISYTFSHMQFGPFLN